MGKVKHKELMTSKVVKLKNFDVQKNKLQKENKIDSADKTYALKNTDAVIGATLLGIVLTVYVLSLYPSLPGGDSGELIVAAYEFGVAHPPGYPLYTLLSQLSINIVPLGSIAWRVNLLTAGLSSLSVFTVYLLILKLCHQKGAAVLGAGIFAFCRLTWFWSTSAEVFSLNNLLLSLLMLTTVELSTCVKENKQKFCLLGSFLCGLCLSNQHTSILFLAFQIPWALCHLGQNKLLSIGHLLLVSCAFLCGLLPYFYLPLSSMAHRARWTWGDQSSVGGFLRHLMRQEYGTWDLLKDHTGQGFHAGLRAYISHVATDLSWMTVGLFALFPISILLRWKARLRGVLLTFLTMFIFYVSFFAWRANLDINNPLFFRVVERFWIQADLLLIVLSAVTFSDCVSFLPRLLYDKVEIKPYFDLAFVIPLIAFQACKSWPECNQQKNTMIEDFSVQALQAFPSNSVILTKGDLCSNSFRYFHLCENVRPDLHIFDQEVLTYNWSLPMMKSFYPGITFPGDFLFLHSGTTEDGRKAFTFRDLIDANINHHPIFACIGVQDHEPSWQEAYTLQPFGVCWKLVKKDFLLDIDQHLEETASFTKHWSYPWTGKPDDGSWEFVANSEMWRAKTASALYFLEQAIVLPEGSDQTRELLLKSYKIYWQEMKAGALVPAYWHRNFAITCERLTRAGTSLKQVDLVKKTVHHFKEFVRREPGDSDAPTIRKAIETLSTYLSRLEKSVQ